MDRGTLSPVHLGVLGRPFLETLCKKMKIKLDASTEQGYKECFQ